jgi:hypothetical protein
MQRVPLLLLAMMLTAPGLSGQTHSLRLGAGALLNVPRIAVLANDGGYTVKGGQAGVRLRSALRAPDPAQLGVFGGHPGHHPAVRLYNELNSPPARYQVDHLAPLFRAVGSAGSDAPVVRGLPARRRVPPEKLRGGTSGCCPEHHQSPRHQRAGKGNGVCLWGEGKPPGRLFF